MRGQADGSPTFDYFRFSAREGDDVPVQLGVPKLPRLRDFRPIAVLLGPGLPEPPASLATGRVQVPTGSGTMVLAFGNTEGATFFEPFTRTTSWVTSWFRQKLPRSGVYHIAIFEPAGRTGKYFLAVGRLERFSPDDVKRLPGQIEDIRRFYEM